LIADRFADLFTPPMEFISEASFWIPDLFVESGWIEHAPFAFWLIQVVRPRILVELGTHQGFSYFVFNQAQQRVGSKTGCFAIDTWRGDEHAGFYGEEVFESVQAHNARYSDFSQLIRSTFEEAITHFADESIDLLHIDGRHFYDDVKRDFETWKPKLSSRGVVLFHDTNVRTHDFGVFRLWDELAAVYPHFEFVHGHGLGLLGVGTDVPHALRSLFAVSHDSLLTTQIQNAYAHLGKSLTNLTLQICADASQHQIALRNRLEAEVQRLNDELARKDLEARQLQEDLAPKRHEYESRLTAKDDELRALARKAAGLHTELLTTRREELQKRETILQTFGAQTEALRREITQIHQIELSQLRAESERNGASLAFYRQEYLKAVSSRSWKVTRPLRAGTGLIHLLQRKSAG
jgi:O-antigen biosynthesis protein